MESKDVQKIVVKYNRNKGFKSLDELQKPLSEKAFDMVKTYVTKMEKDSRLREVTQKTINRVVLIISLIVLIILLVLANLLSALICFSILVALVYFLSFLQAKKLKKITEEYDLWIAGSDWEFFGCKIENSFGKKSWKFYALLPFMNPEISITVHILRKKEETMVINPGDLDNGLIVGKIKSSNFTNSALGQSRLPPHQQSGMPLTIPMKGKLENEKLKSRYKQDLQSSIDLGHHDESLDRPKKFENEKLFS